MKHVKKIMALVLAMAMVLSMGMAVFASETTYTVTITPGHQDEGIHNYEAYQIFTGDLSTDGKTLSNIDWGTGIDQTKLGNLATAINALRDQNAEGYKALTEKSTPQAFADAMGEIVKEGEDSEKAQKIADAIAAALSGTTSGTSGATAVEGLIAGYYMIKDAAKPSAPEGGNSGAMTRYILKVVKSITVAAKASAPSVVKKVQDTNDSTVGTDKADTTEYQDSADYDIGDAVPFKITGTTASTAHDYTKYHITFVDDQSDGLDAPTEFKISVLGEQRTLVNGEGQSTSAIVGKIKVTATMVATGRDFSIKVTFENIDNIGKTDNLVKLGTAVDSLPIDITYTSKLNDNAVLGATGNPNEVSLKYSSNPNSTDDEDKDEGTTPKDKVIVFTYKPIVDKVDENNQPLTGAGFTLYKEVAAGYVAKEGEIVKTGSEIKDELEKQNSSIKTDKLKKDSYYIEKAMNLVEGSQTSFEFKGIDDGTYVLVETRIPNGYNAFEAEEFVVTAEHDDEADNPALKELKGGNRFTGHVDTGALTGTVQNKSGSTLPETGGIGTTIFYVVGSILLVGAAILLITKRRMSVQR